MLAALRNNLKLQRKISLNENMMFNIYYITYMCMKQSKPASFKITIFLPSYLLKKTQGHLNVSCHNGPVHCLFLWYASPDLYIKFIVSKVTCASLGQLGKRHISWPCNHGNHLLIGSRQAFHPLPLKASMWGCWLCLWFWLHLYANRNTKCRITAFSNHTNIW